MVGFGTRKDGRHYPKGMSGKKAAAIKDMTNVEKQAEDLKKAVVKKVEQIEEDAEKGKQDTEKTF